MYKPSHDVYEKFKGLFDRYSAEAGKKQYLIPYLMAAHPGTKFEDMLELSLWLKRQGLFVDQVQTFLPSPMTLATAMYHTGKDPLHPDTQVHVARDIKSRRIQKAFLRYHDARNWPLLREALRTMGRGDLIGNGKRHLIPAWQPALDGALPRAHSASGKAATQRMHRSLRRSSRRTS
jgi:radical SAM superfamily enzyme YgiQ (UPF0313 family)